MRDAFGGIMNIVIIAVFLVIVEGILGMTVNYSKAFRMKNYVISVIEQYEGNNGCFSSTSCGNGGNCCKEKIRQHAIQLGYSPAKLNCHSGYTDVDGFFCYKRLESNNSGYSAGEYASYRIVTQVDIGIPIINNIMGLEFFQVTGDTRLIKLNN